jgi:hypothetical protein
MRDLRGIWKRLCESPHQITTVTRKRCAKNQALQLE